MIKLILTALLLICSSAHAFTAGTYKAVTTGSYLSSTAVYTNSAASPTAACSGAVPLNPAFIDYSTSSGDASGFICVVHVIATNTFQPFSATVYSFVAAPVASSGVPTTTVNADVSGLASAVLAIDDTMTKIFTLPPSADIAKVWFIGFGLPLTLYLVAWGFGVVVNSFRHRHDD